MNRIRPSNSRQPDPAGKIASALSRNKISKHGRRNQKRQHPQTLVTFLLAVGGAFLTVHSLKNKMVAGSPATASPGNSFPPDSE
jgi:hypothetical protein